MRLGTFNVMHGRSADDGLVDADRLHDAVAALDIDVLAAQEVDLDQPRSGRLNQAAILARALGAAPGDWRFEATVYGTPGVAWRAADGRRRGPDEPAYGVAVVSRLPVRSWQVVRLGRARLRAPVAVPGPSGRVRLMLLDDEPRVAIVGVVDAPFGPMMVAATHLSFVPGWNAVQLRRLVRSLAGMPRPVVLLGDLNLPGATGPMVSRMRRLATAPTYPASAPRFQLDHVLARGALPAVVAADARRTAVSDHCALLVDLADQHPGHQHPGHRSASANPSDRSLRSRSDGTPAEPRIDPEDNPEPEDDRPGPEENRREVAG